MEMFYCTFGMAHENSMCCQPIKAETREKAQQEMFRLYGSNWSSIYTEKEYEEGKKEGIFLEKLLTPVIVN